MIAIRARAGLRVSLAAATLALGLNLVAPVPPAAAAQDPTALIQQIGTEGVAALQPNITVPQRLKVLGQLFRQDFDVRGIGTFAMGRYRVMATPRERHEYFRLFDDFAVRAVSNKLDDYAGAAFRITGTRRNDDGQIIVSSQLARGATDPISLEWSLQHKHGRYMVSDLKVGEVSMRVALRDQFASWIESNGGRFSALLAVLRQMNTQLH